MAIEYLHAKKIVHRDIKPQNILIDSSGHIKLSDFGFAMHIIQENKDDKLYRSPLFNKKLVDIEPKMVGSAAYLAPEIIRHNTISPDGDWWAVGVIAFELILGKLPFEGKTLDSLLHNITHNQMEPYSVGFDDNCLSPEANSLILGFLTQDPNCRLGHHGAIEIKSHPFFLGINWETLRKDDPPFVPKKVPEDPTFYFPSDKAFPIEEYVKSVEDNKITTEASNLLGKSV